MKKILIFLLLFVIFFGFSNYSSLKYIQAKTLEQELKEANQKLKEARLLAEQAKKEGEKLNYQLFGYNKEKEEVEKKLAQKGFELQELIQELNVQIAEFNLINKQIDVLERSISDKEKKMGKILTILYKNYTLNYSAFLFSSKSFNEILDKSLYLQYLHQADKAYCVNLKSEKDMRDKNRIDRVSKTIDLNEKKLKVVNDQKNYADLEKQKTDQIQTVNSELEKNRLMILQYNEMSKKTEARIKDLLKKIAEQDRIKRLGNAPWGKIMWPVSGKVSSFFGMRMHPIFQVYRMHTGIDIDATSGTPIHSCAKGIVVFAGWLDGYGNTVIIQHNATYSSLYAHQRSYQVTLDQMINMGDIIGWVGATGWATEPHLHFEIRIKGDAVNPLNYLPK